MIETANLKVILFWADAPDKTWRRKEETYMLLLIVVFVIGVFVGYKYPQQVEQVVQYGKDLKDKFFKKTPQG